MSLSIELGVSPRRLFGWEPSQVTEILRDKQGRVVQLLSRRESEFSDSDREMLLAYTKRQSMILSHGQPIDEVTDARANPTYYGEGAYRYLVHYELDHAQAAIDAERAKLKAQNPDMDLSAYLFWTERKDY